MLEQSYVNSATMLAEVMENACSGGAVPTCDVLKQQNFSVVEIIPIPMGDYH